ncbi:MAG TPA: glycosyltransferase family 4 protein [Pyrinomonadaceae bacterium]|nr:glycosyltransferase family 4 protein [Pyrinomonadaceae bacterium]
MYKIFAAYIAVFTVSFWGVELFRRWSLKRELLDVPNERSSHSVPTPRGGGLIICVVSIVTFLIYSLVSGGNFYWSYFVGAIIVAAISLIDDVRTISPFLRILFHGLAAGIVVWSLGGFREILIPFYGIVEFGIWGNITAFLWIVWLINAYNFMDGIDGIAATQAVSAGIGWSLVGLISGIEDIGFYGGVLALSSFGFLLLNRQPAKIFMGDVGSAFLGYSFAVLPLFAVKSTGNPVFGAMLPWIALFLVWFFVFDSVFTFLKRLFRGEKVWQAHREHIYQKMVISGLSHSTVTGLYGSASAILVLALVLTIGYSMNFEKTVFGVIFFETVLLIFIWQKAGGSSRKTHQA